LQWLRRAKAVVALTCHNVDLEALGKQGTRKDISNRKLINIWQG